MLRFRVAATPNSIAKIFLFLRPVLVIVACSGAALAFLFPSTTHYTRRPHNPAPSNDTNLPVIAPSNTNYAPSN
jgi:hypothetical protein